MRQFIKLSYDCRARGAERAAWTHGAIRRMAERIGVKLSVLGEERRGSMGEERRGRVGEVTITNRIQILLTQRVTHQYVVGYLNLLSMELESSKS